MENSTGTYGFCGEAYRKGSIGATIWLEISSTLSM